MKKNRFFIFIFAISVILSSCASSKAEEIVDLGIKGQSFRNPKPVVINAKGNSAATICGGEFYKFDFSALKNDKENRFAIVEVVNKAGNQISLYSIGFSKHHFYDTFYVSPNAGKINIALSNSEYSYTNLKESLKVEESDLPVTIYNKQILSGEMNGLDFTMFDGYFSREGQADAGTTYGIVECFDETNQVINKKIFPASATGKTKGFLIPVKTCFVRFSISASPENSYISVDSLSVKPSDSPATIKSFVSASFRTLDFGVYQNDIKQDYGVIEYLDENSNVIFTDYIRNDGNGKIAGKVYIPRAAVHANVILHKDPSQYDSALDYIDILSSSNPSAIKVPSSYFEANKCKTEEVDANLAKFIKYLDMKTLKSEPDVFVEFIVEKVNQLASNDFEKIKLYHDATLLTLNYQENWTDPLIAGDFRTAIKRGSGNSYAFSTLFKEFCRAGGFYCINVFGNAKKLDHVAKVRVPTINETLMEYSQEVIRYNNEVKQYNDFVRIDYSKINQSWNIVFINDMAYLVDCSLDSKESATSKFYSNEWLFMPPEEFINSHMPFESEFQLLEKTLTVSEYGKIQYKDYGKKVVLLETLPVELTKEELKMLKKQQKIAAKQQTKLEKQQAKLKQEHAKLEAEQAMLEQEQERLEQEHSKLQQELTRIEREQKKLKRKAEKEGK